MEVVEVLVGTDTVKIMAIALVVIAITIGLAVRLASQWFNASKEINEQWKTMATTLTNALESQLAATETLIDLVEVASKSYDELTRMIRENHGLITDMRNRIEGVIGEAGVVDKQVVAKLDAILDALNHVKSL